MAAVTVIILVFAAAAEYMRLLFIYLCKIKTFIRTLNPHFDKLLSDLQQIVGEQPTFSIS